MTAVEPGLGQGMPGDVSELLAASARGDPAAPDKLTPLVYDELRRLVELDQLLTRLERRSEQQGRIIELRYFAGLSIPEIAAALQIFPGTVKRQWRLARAWLYREMRKE